MGKYIYKAFARLCEPFYGIKFDDLLKTFLTLDVVGVIAALVFGVLIFFLGSGSGAFLLFIILAFLVVSAVVTRIGKTRKRRMKTYEMARGWRNVVANGIVPLLIAFGVYINSNFSLGWPYSLHYIMNFCLEIAYIGSVAAITADKFSSEIGIMDNNAVMLMTFKRVKPGISGGVSLYGTLAGALGAFIIGIFTFSLVFSSLSMMQFVVLVVIVGLSGIMGNIVDSLLGYFEEKGAGSKYTSNIACAVAGALFGVLFFFLFSHFFFLL